MDPLAHRVASRYLQAISSPDALARKLETSAHRAGEMLHLLEQQYKFWMGSLPAGNSRATGQAYDKMQTFIKTFQHEVNDAMAALEELEHEEEQQASGF